MLRSSIFGFLTNLKKFTQHNESIFVICTSIDPFLIRIITGDEKWIVYNNVNQKRSKDQKKSMMNQHKPYQKLSCIKKKIMLSIWWDYKGVVYFELLPTNRTINSNVYFQQLVKLQLKQSKRKDQNWQIAKESCSTTTMRDLTHLQQHVRNYWSLVGK